MSVFRSLTALRTSLPTCTRSVVSASPSAVTVTAPSVFGHNNGEHRHQQRPFHSTLPTGGLEEFIDKTLFEGKQLESAGRAWRINELRRKSMEDLNKLWFICYKERNMLLTHIRLAKTMRSKIAHPERLRKVRTTMARIKKVLHERHTLAMRMAKEEFERRKAAGVYQYPVDFNDEHVQRIVRELAEDGLVSDEVAERVLLSRDETDDDEEEQVVAAADGEKSESK